MYLRQKLLVEFRVKMVILVSVTMVRKIILSYSLPNQTTI